MSISKPHYLLFSGSEVTARRHRGSAAGGKWRFQLESVDGTSSFEAGDEESDITRERLELLAIVRGLEALDQPSRVTLLTGSRYVSHGIRFGLHAWRDSGWRWEEFGRMAPVPNSDLWMRIEQALQFHSVRCKQWQAAEARVAERQTWITHGMYALKSFCWKGFQRLHAHAGRTHQRRLQPRRAAALCPQA